MGVIDQLQKSGKGRISYEREGSPKNLKDFLSTCTSPPSIHVSPNFARNHSKNEQADGDTQKSFVDPKRSSSPVSSVEDVKVSKPERSTSQEGVQKEVPRPFITAEFSKSRLSIQKYEEELESNARRALLEKKRLFEETKLRLEREAEVYMQEHDQQANFDVLMKIQSIELSHESQAVEIQKQHRKLKETHEHRKSMVNAKMQEAEQTRERLRQEELKLKELRRQELLEKMNKCVNDLSSLNTKVQAKYGACQYQEKVSEAAKKSLSLIQTRVTAAEKLKVDFQQSGEPSLNLFEKCKDLLEQSGNAYEFVCKELENAEKEGQKAKDDAEKQADLLKQQQELAEERRKQVSLGQPLATSTPGPSTTSSIVSSSTLSDLAAQGASLCVYPETYTKCIELQEKLKKVEETIVVLTSTPELKKLKFDIQKAVNTPINAISPVSGEHLRDKLKKLLQLLSGQVVDVGNKQVSLKQHPQAPLFCKHLIARMVVKKGAEMVSSKHETAFAIAMVVVGLWREQPDIGDLVLAMFYRTCPYLIPYYIPKEQDQSNEEYLKARGYLYDSDGSVEKQEKFLKRMSGIMRLYFSIMVSFPPRGKHPHGMEYAWSWFSQVLNLEPEPDITATMIYDFLQVVGHSLLRKYNKQFLKLLHILVKETVPRLEEVSSAAGGGSLSRLKLLLENSLRNQGQIPEPEGYLRANFWLS